jgi:predicted dehydrogenase
MIKRGSKALLVGCGSIGKKHLQELLPVFEAVTVLDINEDALAWAKAEGAERVSVTKAFSDLSTEIAEEPFDIAVIANWGPDHVRTIRELLAFGQRNFVAEKPLADSIADVRAIGNEVRSVGGKLWINLTRRFSGLQAGIEKLSVEHNLGKLQSINVIGGARCFATNGIHYLDFANFMFGERPETVMADLATQNINPRHESLAFYEGTAVYKYSDSRRFTISLNNSSSINEYAQLLWADAEGGLFPNGDFVLKLRDAKEIKAYPSITRTGNPVQEVFRGNLWKNENGLTGMAALYQTVIAGDDLAQGSAPDPAFTAEDLLAALISSEKGMRLQIPVTVSEADAARHWNIS